jgi:hypothetical protein
MARRISIKDIGKLLELFQHLENLLNPELPEKNKELCEKSLKQAKKDFIEELKNHESRLSPARTPPRRASKEEEKEFQKAFQDNTTKIAEKKYRQMDSNYDQTILQIEKKRTELIKGIDHLLYSLRESIMEFDRAHGTLLEADWQKIRDFLPVIDIDHPNFQFYVQNAIDALEAIKCKVKQQQPGVGQRIEGWLWTLYEKTLKVIFDAVLERMCPK